MFDGEPATQHSEPDPLRRALQDAIAAAQALRLDTTAGTLMGVLFMHKGAPGACLDLLRGIERTAQFPNVLDGVRRAIALLEQAQRREAA